MSATDRCLEVRTQIVRCSGGKSCVGSRALAGFCGSRQRRGPGRWPWACGEQADRGRADCGRADCGRVALCVDRWACCSQVANGWCHVSARLHGEVRPVGNLGDADCGLRRGEEAMPSVGGASRKLSEASWGPNDIDRGGSPAGGPTSAVTTFRNFFRGR
eukprot:scaffold7608_cov62-Phaeocystis_antarctica.AAC.5